MEYPLQEFDGEHETEFLLGNSSNHGSDMDVHTARSNRNPKRRKTLRNMLCGWVVTIALKGSLILTLIYYLSGIFNTFLKKLIF